VLKYLKARGLRGHVRAQGGRPRRGLVKYEDITDDLRASGVDMRAYAVPVVDFESYVDTAGYRLLDYYGHTRDPAAREKCLEHFVSLELIEPKAGEVLIDVASMNSPFSGVAAETHELVTYRQDLMFPSGRHGDTIGGDAADMSVPDSFADHMVLHCSFEHFEGDSDTTFIQEACRVLKPGGRLCILPLYTTSEYAIQIHPRGLSRQRIRFEPGDAVYVSDGWGPAHQRFYDAEAFQRRIVAHLDRLELTIYTVTNLDEVGGDVYLRYAALFRKVA
jgi:hypothetical protein